MTNYLLKYDDTYEHYFFKPYEGICMRTITKGSKSDYTSITDSASDCFGVYADKRGCVHLCTIDKEHRLVYAIRRNGEWKKFILSRLSEEIFVSDMRLYSIKGRLNLLYSALYNGENMLVHCMLGDHAKPSTVSLLKSAGFFLCQNKVYYTNPKGQFGFTNLSDEKPDDFTIVAENTDYGSVFPGEEGDITIYVRESKLFVNHEEILYDVRMEMPVCQKSGDRLYIMWKSGGYVRYITSLNGGTTWSEPMRFMGNGQEVALFLAQNGNYFDYYYGFINSQGINLLGKPDIFTSCSSRRISAVPDMKSIRESIYAALDEIEKLKKELRVLNDRVAELKGSPNKSKEELNFSLPDLYK